MGLSGATGSTCSFKDQLVASTEIPRAPVGDVARLNVTASARASRDSFPFLNRYMLKDLFRPFRAGILSDRNPGRCPELSYCGLSGFGSHLPASKVAEFLFAGYPDLFQGSSP